MKELHFKVIPHAEQHYNTIGDYFTNGAVEEFRSSDLGDNTAELAVFIHELVERHWNELHGITTEASEEFDAQFEDKASQGLVPADVEPGDDPASPYYRGHQIATVVERVFTELFGLDWQKYEAAMMKLWRPKG
jgi:hypothetical protein